MAGPTVGGAFLSASLQVLLNQIASREVLVYLRGQKLSDTLLRKLKIKLLAVQAVLDDAEAKQFTNSSVINWLDELKDVVYDAEDLMEDIAAEALRCKMESDSQSQVRNIISAEGIESRVEGVNDILEFLVQQKNVLGLKEGVGKKFSQRRRSTSLVDESGVYGRDDNKEEMVEFLLSRDAGGKNISVIAVVGMGGIGKTTLAQLVYNDRRVVKSFDLKAWVCVSDEFDLLRITKTILKAIDSGASDKFSDENDLNLLQIKLKEKLSRKKFFLVLDDVWNENYANWEMLQTPFSVGLNGSKILVTARSKKVASVMRSVRIHHLGQLSFEDCWSLFAQHAFENGDSSLHPELEEIGKGIVKKCKGLPLAAKTLGGALYSEFQVKEWEYVLNSETWDLPTDEILPALWLSYSFLPSHLKQCFAYCSIFPKDYEIEKEKLILLWMAEGLLQQSEGTKTMEEMGNGYFHELLSRFFFQKSRNDKCFVMHDLLNDLAQLVSRKFGVQLRDGMLHEIPKKLRHFSFFRGEYDTFERFKTLGEANSIRTFLPLLDESWPRLHLNIKVSIIKIPTKFGDWPRFQLSNKIPNDLLLKVQYLRVLSLCLYRIVDLPYSIGKLKHLRYLDLSYTSLTRLPESVCGLYNLQTLILHFCDCLVELPTMMSKLIGLRHLDIRNTKVTEMPSQIGQLKGLQNLSNYIVGKQSGTRIGELKELSHIGESLAIQQLQNVVDAKDALAANLVGKRYLNELELEWNGDDGVENNGVDLVLDNLQPHSNLKGLTINGYCGSRFPDWLGGASMINVVSLRLWSCKNVSTFPPLGKLPSLKYLYIYGLNGIERVGAEFYGADSSSTKPSFPSLEALSFQNMVEWKEWSCLRSQGGEFPCLKKLFILNCPKLTGALPNHLPFLKRLDIERCEQLVAPLPRVPGIRELTTCNCKITWWKELLPELRYLSIETMDSLESLHEDGMLQSNTSLEDFRISNCSFSLLVNRLCLPLKLKSLIIKQCKELEFLVPELLKSHHPFLEHLSITDSTCSISCFPLGNFPSLDSLYIQNLEGLESLSISISDRDHPSLNRLDIKGCPNLVSIELVTLNISRYSIYRCNNLKWLLHNSASFQTLRLEDCPALIFPIQGLPSSLASFSIENCKKLTSQVELDLQGLASLATLKISGLPNLTSLHSMGLQLLTSLKKLEICDCPKLQSLTDEGLPTSLSFLIIQKCPLLKDRCKFWTGEDWHHIAHIQRILIDDQVL